MVRKFSRQTGFTLLELLVVLVIVGIITSVAILSVSGVFAGNRLNNTAQQLYLTVQYAQQQAILSNDTLGLNLFPAHYQFYRYQQDKNPPYAFSWQIIDQSRLLKLKKLPTDINATLIINKKVVRPKKMTPTTSPAIIFYNDGSLTAFTALLSDHEKNQYRLQGKANGELSLHLLSEPTA